MKLLDSDTLNRIIAEMSADANRANHPRPLVRPYALNGGGQTTPRKRDHLTLLHGGKP